MPSDFGPSQYHSTYTTTGEQDKFIIGFVSLEANVIAIEVDKNKSKVTTIIYIIANVIFIPSWLFSSEY